MPAPLNIDSRREAPGSHLSSSSSSVITLRPGDGLASPSDIRRGISPLNSAPATNANSTSQSSTFLGTYPPRHIPSRSPASPGITTPPATYGEQDGRPSYVPLAAPTAGLKRHISFSKRFSLSSGTSGLHGEIRPEIATSRSMDIGLATRNHLSSENPISTPTGTTSKPSWTNPIKSPGIEVNTASPVKDIAKSPRMSPGSRRFSSTHDPYDYRKNSPQKDTTQQERQELTLQSTPEEVPRRTPSRHKYQQQLGQSTEDKSVFRFGSGEGPSHVIAPASVITDSRDVPSSSTSTKGIGQKDKKSMLSRALQRANDAVALDNAQNYPAAKEAYEEACDYLSRVMARSSNEEDKRRLMGIRTTYTARIEELQQLGSRVSLRSEEESSDSISQASSVHASFDGAPDERTITSIGQTAVKGKLEGDQLEQRDKGKSIDSVTQDNFGPRSLTGHPVGMRLRMGENDKSAGPAQAVTQLTPKGLFSPPSSESSFTQKDLPEQERQTLPEDAWKASRIGSPRPVQTSANSGVARRPSQASSNHSLTSINGLRRRHLRIGSGETEAEFDAALDAAVEAVYDDGYEPYENDEARPVPTYYSRMATNNRAIHDYDSFAEREATILAIRNGSAAQLSLTSTDSISEVESDTETDEEERILDDVTRKLKTENQVENQTKSTIPRQSDSSGSSGRTWASSGASSISTVATPLSPVDESRVAPSAIMRQQIRNLPPPTPPPTSALPRLPASAFVPGPHHSQNPGIQERRLSGQRTRRLQIKTVTPSKGDPRAISASDLSSTSENMRMSESFLPATPNSTTRFDTKASVNTRPHAAILANESQDTSPLEKQVSNVTPLSSTASGFSPTASRLPMAVPSNSNIRSSPDSMSPESSHHQSHIQRPPFAKSISSVSLLTKVRSSDTTDFSETSPETPVSFGFTAISPPGWKVTAPATVAVVSPPPIPHVDNVPLFASEMHDSTSPTSQTPRILHPPRPLEPCPESCLLRPFWLLRCVYQTIAHPRGGYITRKLFIPREVWKTKNLKLRAVEEKILACDLLTPALLKLGHVNTLDADAVLDEFQALEAVMDQVQSILTKKLGNEVGVHHIATFFKDAPPTISVQPPSDTSESATHSFSTDQGTNASSTGSFGKASGKSSFNLSSWRKLRNRNSSTSLSASFSSVKDTPKESLVMASLPMAGTNNEEPMFRGNRRSMLARPVVGAADAMKMDGPNANYMAALARLCEAVQILDQIARQVEDPGLKASSPTHVGLELSARHAAEFFGFYICRFVLQDVTILAEKFIKRASEWVML